ncbi:IS630 transposase-related protein [Psychrobacter sp. 78a-MNA-CIBAN-0178]|uniref:IS630 transposase-related protein n=1 Tax=Psychrobacter sp. 78a-MNA-CIBAN-0178 TaxID=3140450 RepID=UPI00332B325A
MAYSKDYRQMILDKLEMGYSYRQLVEEYQISATTIQRWKKNPEPKVYKRVPYKIDNDALIADVKEHPDDYHYERARRFNCSDRGISKALKRLNITQKKDT